jgi:hypothetical protein
MQYALAHHWDNILWFVLMISALVSLRNKPRQFRNRVAVVFAIIAVTCFGALVVMR